MGFLESSVLSLLFSTAAGAASPAVDVYNAASMIPAAVQNVAQGSRIVFRMTGSGIGPSRRMGANPPLPMSIAGLSLQANVGGAQAYPCIMIYAAFEEVGAILPSNVPPGDGQLTLYFTAADGTMSGGPNAPIHVVPVNFGIYTYNGLGGGPGFFIDASANTIDITNPAHNSDTVSLRGTGLGPIMGDETMPPPQMDLNSGVQIFVGGQPATVLYGGRAGGGPGQDRIDFVVPDGVSGCYVSVYAKVAGIVSNFTTIPVMAPDQTFCADPMLGFSGADLQPNAGGVLNAGVLDLTQLAGGQQGDGNFNQFDLDTLVSAPNLGVAPSIGSCIAYDFHGTAPAIPNLVQPPGLDAGSQLNLTGSGGSVELPLAAKGNYTARLGGGGGGRPPFLSPGVYTIDNGKGGADIGPFSASITLPAGVVWTNQAALPGSIPRSQDLRITWTGGGPSDVVGIFGGSVSPAVPNGLTGEFLCTAKASDGQFTVPADVIANLPATILPLTTPTAVVSVGTFATARFTAPGLDFGYAWTLLSTQQTVAFQ